MNKLFNPLLILPLLFFSCSDEGTSTVKMTQENNPETIEADTDQDTIAEAPIVAVSDSVRFVFSGAFVPSDFKTSNWIGMYQDDNGMYCKSTKAYVKVVGDVWGDYEDPNVKFTIIKDVSKDSSLFLFSGISVPENLRTRAFRNTLNELNKVEIGKTVKVGKYTLKAEGNLAPESGSALTYKLSISGPKKGKNIDQIIVNHEFLDDGITEILWIGDLDADGIPDMIIDMSETNCISSPALFLSSKADEGKLLKLVAECESDFGSC